MNILCCFKIVADYDKVVQRDWDTAQIPGPDLSYVGRIISCYDEAGLESALRIKDAAEKSGDTVSLSAVTLGNGSYDYFFRSLFALGFERIVQISLPEPVTFTPERVSSAICEVFEGQQFDAVICGVQSADGCGGTSPYLLAKKLAMPCIPNVIEIGYQKDSLRIRRETVSGESSATVSRPAVYAIGNSVNPFLRMATVKKRMAAAQCQPEIIEAADLGECENEPVVLQGFAHSKAGRGCVFVEGESCAQKAENLLKLCPEVKRT